MVEAYVLMVTGFPAVNIKYYLGDALWNDVGFRMRSLCGGSGGRGGGGMDGSGTITVQVGRDVVDVADLQAGGTVHRSSAAVIRRLNASTLQRKLAGGSAVEVVVN